MRQRYGTATDTEGMLPHNKSGVRRQSEASTALWMSLRDSDCESQRCRATRARALQKHPVEVLYLSPVSRAPIISIAGPWALPTAIAFHAFSVKTEPSLSWATAPSLSRRKFVQPTQVINFRYEGY